MTQWQRIDGTLLAADVAAQRGELLDYFTRHQVQAVLEFHPAAPWYVGLRLWVDDDGRVAAASGTTLVPGLEVEELAEDIAERFGVDVLLDQVEIVHEDDEDHDHADACDLGPRVVSLLPRADASDLPVLARELDETLTAVTTPGGEAILTEPGGAFPGLDGAGANTLPLVQVIVDGEERTLLVQAADGEPTSFAWGIEPVVVVGAAEPSSEQRERAELLASDEDVVATLQSVAPAADAAALRASLGALPAEGPGQLLAALGATEVAGFLAGERPAAAVPQARSVAPARPVEVLRSTLGAAAEDVSELRIVGLADEFQRRQPVLSRTLSVLQAVAGAAILARASRRDTPWRAAAVTTGTLLLVDGIGELALYEWLRRRR
ncbi:MAG: hypothetical protein GX427_07790 [Actinomycetales bacterium]|nr:hypothetical protein [Actinomycetales bacterium]